MKCDVEIDGYDDVLFAVVDRIRVEGKTYYYLKNQDRIEDPSEECLIVGKGYAQITDEERKLVQKKYTERAELEAVKYGIF